MLGSLSQCTVKTHELIQIHLRVSWSSYLCESLLTLILSSVHTEPFMESGGISYLTLLLLSRQTIINSPKNHIGCR